jgi:cytochrome b6-f complex iron-sulfur subunit
MVINMQPLSSRKRNTIMDRRTFMSWVGLGLLANSLPVAIAASVEAKPRADGFVSVGTLKQLQSDGVIQVPKFATGPLLVIRNPQDSKKLIAVNATCTHKGCKVNWQAKSKQFACPCHGSAFKSDGSVANGPASKPLASYKVKVEGNSVLVKAA